MSDRWLNLFLHFSGYIFNLKQKIVQANSWLVALPNVILLLLVELCFIIISFPLYLIVSPKQLQERGLIFPSQEKEQTHFHIYIIRRRISLTTVLSAGGIFLLKFVFIGLVSSYLLGAQALLAATQNWDFNTASDYTYDSSKIEVTGGVAKLVDQGGGGSCGGTATACSVFVSSPTCTAQVGCSWGGSASGATTNPNFSANTTGWTYADWDQGGGEVNINGGRTASDGNPGGYINISAPVGKEDELGGYWRQGFTTTVANPTATVSFDWKVKDFDTTPNPITYKIYVFVDTGTGVPVIGQEVWSSGELTNTTDWASVSNLDVSSKVVSAGTYYLKLAMWVETPGSNSGPFAAGFDNVQLNWSTTPFCSGTATACTSYLNSGTCSAQGGCAWTPIAVYPASVPEIYPNTSLAPVGVTSWNAFTETATKGTGEIYYQLSDDDGVSWKYWDGSAWLVISAPANYNTASVVNAHINSFSAVAGKIKWKAFLSSNGSQQVILDNVAVGYLQNSPPSVQGLSVSQDTASGYVYVNYSLQDNENDPCSLVNYEYSLTGAFTGEQLPMTPASSDPAHNGVTGLAASSGGTAHTFVWNAAADFGNIFQNTVYVRLRANDGIVNSSFNATPGSIAVDYISPIISNVSATQLSNSSNVSVGYNLSDDTANNILVELQISSDGGSTWAVPAVSVSGNIGESVSSGDGKTIIWDTETDYANQEQNNMMVRVRAKDKYQNQGSYVSSASFILDNKSPVVATVTNLLAQPLAGATSVLVGGSFTENNPNTNNFQVALNDGAYDSVSAGDTNTATPSDKSVPVGTTLKGNDFISSVKIVHTDDFGHVTDNENTLPTADYKYVKPYTPPAPTIDSPGEDSLSVTIRKHASEVEGLEYVIFESTQNMYVQGDGSLNSEPYWQTVGTITATGLSQPISQYSFKVKSRNTSDEGHALASESEYSSSASSNYQSSNILLTSVAQTTDGSKYVVINYIGTDYQNANNNLVKYEYSLNGTDWLTMTEKTGVGSSGITDLNFNNTGAGLKFAWDVGLDLPNVEDSAVYVRLQSNDGITNSNMAVSAAFMVNTAGPVISNISATQTAGTNNVFISYDLADSAGANNVVALSISDDSGATYNVAVPNVGGSVGNNVTAGLGRTIIWNAGLDLANQEKNTMKVKLVATDSYGNQGTPAESADFTVDTKAPEVSSVSAGQNVGSALVTVSYSLADISASTVEFQVSADSGANWTIANNTVTGDIGAGQTAGAKAFTWNAATDFPNQELDTMRIRVRALDVFGHQGDYQESTDFSVNTKVLSISNITAVQNTGAKTVTIHYNINKAATVSLDISADGGTTWSVATSTLFGAVGTVTAGNKTVSWNPGVDFSNEEKSSMRIRLSGIDSAGTVSPYYESDNFAIDTAAPLGLLILSKFASTDTSVTMNWSSGIADANFDHYELWYGTNQNDVINRNGTAQKWSVANDANLSSVTTISTVITGITLTSDLYVKIWAVDSFNSEATVVDLNVFSAVTSTPPVIEINSGGGTVTTNDVIAPEKPILSPIVSPTNKESVIISGLSEAGSKINLYDNGIFVNQLENIADENGNFSQSFTFSDGEHVLTVTAIDSSLNASVPSDVIILVVVTKAPEAPVILSPQNESRITNGAPTFIGVVGLLNKVEILLDGQNIAEVESDQDGAWQFKLPTDLALKDGNHTFVFRTIDLAGNKSVDNVLVLTKVAPPVEVVVQPTLEPINSLVSDVIPAPVTTGGTIVTTPVLTPALPSAELVRENIAAVELAGIPIPQVTNVNTISANDVFTFTGKALPNQEVLVYVHSDQALIYRTKADASGVWQVNHSQTELELAPGQHTIYAVAVDSSAKIKSKPSLVSTFTVEKSFWVSMFEKLNFQTTVITLVAVLLSMVWLYQIKKTETARV